MADVKIANLTTKTSPLDTDIMIIEDNSDTKKITYANLKSGLFSNPVFTGTQTLPNIVTNGIKFPATQVPSADSNTLDDYEEGSFTPSLTIGDSETGITYTARVGKYTKIGNIVYVRLGIALTSKGTNTGALKITGLPFACFNLGYADTQVSLSGLYLSGLTGGLVATVNNALSTIVPYQINAFGQANLTNVNLGNSSLLFVSGTYIVA